MMPDLDNKFWPIQGCYQSFSALRSFLLYSFEIESGADPALA